MDNNLDKNKIKEVDDAKIRILNAAREVFAEKGYDAASIAEISKRAKVNKALPYYYFKNKRELLQELISEKVDDIFSQRMASIKGTKTIKESVPEFYSKIIDYTVEKKQLFNIMVTELVKEVPESEIVLKTLNPAFEGAIPVKEELGFKIDKMEDLVKSFFLSFMPIVMFSLIGEKWSDFYGFDREKVKKVFSKAFNDIYIKHIMEVHFKDKKV